jgi:hypothetical protein
MTGKELMAKKWRGAKIGLLAVRHSLKTSRLYFSLYDTEINTKYYESDMERDYFLWFGKYPN